MRIRSLSVKGLTVFNEKTTIDFTQLPPGLIAITGPNGAGKTSLLEAGFAALHRELPSRPDENLHYYCHGKDAFVEIGVDLGAHTYKAKLLINAVSEDVKAFLECDGVPIEECRQGKLVPFGKAVDRIFGSKQLLLASVWSVQSKRGNFAEMAVADRKNLFIELLGLGQFPIYEKKAKDRVTAIDRELIEKRSKKEVLRLQMEKYKYLANLIAECTTEIATVTPRVESADERRKELQAKEVTITSKLAELEAVLTDRVSARLQRGAKLSEDLRAVGTRQKERAAIVRTETQERQAAITRLGTRIIEINQRIENNKKLLLQESDIRTAVTAMETCRAMIGKLDAELTTAMEHEVAHQRLASEKALAQANLRTVEQNISNYRTAIAELSQVPCQAAGIYAGCVKITNVVTYRDKNLPEATDLTWTISKRIEELDSALSQNGCRPSRIIQLERTAEQAEITRLEPKVKLAASIDTTAQRIAEHAQSLTETQRQLTALEAQGTTTDPLLEELNAQVTAIEAERAALNKELSEPVDTSERDVVQRLRDDVRAEIVNCQAGLNDDWRLLSGLESSLAGAKEEIALIRDVTVDHEQTLTDIARLELDLGDMTLLTRALGKDGITALEIDAAGPGISMLVNDLLSSCFSTRFTIDLQTQRESADGKKQIEDFNVRVIDSVKNREGTIDDLSGGEKVIVSEALALGIALYNKGTHDLETCWRDETTGALSVDMAPHYVAMLRRAMQLGHFHRIIFITHNPECAELADARIRCLDGKVTVEL